MLFSVFGVFREKQEILFFCYFLLFSVFFSVFSDFPFFRLSCLLAGFYFLKIRFLQFFQVFLLLFCLFCGVSIVFNCSSFLQFSVFLIAFLYSYSMILENQHIIGKQDETQKTQERRHFCNANPQGRDQTHTFT